MGLSKKNKGVHIIDALLMLLHITYGMSMLRVWLLDPLPWRTEYVLLLVTLMTFVLYSFRFGLSFNLFSVKHKGLLWMFIILYVTDIIQNLYYNPERVFHRVVLLLDIFIFMEYVYSVYLESKGIKKDPLREIVRYYEYYNVYNIVVVILCLSLIVIGILSSRDNPLATNSLTVSNVNAGTQYFYPGHLSLAIDNYRGLAMFNIPVLTGLTHEPHVLWFYIGPCFFLFLLRLSEKSSSSLVLLLYVLYFSLLIIATSTSAIIAFSTVFVIHQLYNIFFDENKLKNFFLLILTMGIFAVFMSRGGGIFDDVITMVDSKLESENDIGTKGFSMSMLNYLVSPQNLFGRGNMPDGTGFELIGQDIGFVTCILDIVFYFFYLTKVFKFIFSRDRQTHFWGMMFLYFFLHNFKMSVQSFNYPYFSYIVILMIIISNAAENKGNNYQRYRLPNGARHFQVL